MSEPIFTLPASWDTPPTPTELYETYVRAANTENELSEIDRQIRDLEAKYKKSHPRDPATRDLATQELREKREIVAARFRVESAYIKVLEKWIDISKAFAWSMRKMS